MGGGDAECFYSLFVPALRSVIKGLWNGAREEVALISDPTIYGCVAKSAETYRSSRERL